eukprot:3464659-Rhodomonas_salina.1
MGHISRSRAMSVDARKNFEAASSGRLETLGARVACSLPRVSPPHPPADFDVQVEHHPAHAHHVIVHPRGCLPSALHLARDVKRPAHQHLQPFPHRPPPRVWLTLVSLQTRRRPLVQQPAPDLSQHVVASSSALAQLPNCRHLCRSHDLLPLVAAQPVNPAHQALALPLVRQRHHKVGELALRDPEPCAELADQPPRRLPERHCLRSWPRTLHRSPRGPR